MRQDVGTPSMASSLDKHFIEQMIPHHEGAVEMAKLAQERSKHPGDSDTCQGDYSKSNLRNYSDADLVQKLV